MLGLLLLRGLFSRYGKQALLSSCGARASHYGGSLVAEHRLQSAQASMAAVAPGLWTTGSGCAAPGLVVS